jgi:N-acetylglucosaminyldiphosphoundecaprenol N-acetyl-beta-D-mannosaminyltransferase
MTTRQRIRVPVFGVLIDLSSAQWAIEQIITWGRSHQSRIVTLSNVHAVVTAREDVALRAALSEADLVLPDGAPIAWSMRRKGYAQTSRVAGPDLMAQLLKRCEQEALSVFLYGSTEQTLDALAHKIMHAYPRIQLAGKVSPPFGPLSEATLEEGAAQINRVQPHIVLVGLGCPKQEIWMHAQRGLVHAPMVGLGAAFDFMAGCKARAPRWVRAWGMEWLYRLAQEPRRLAGRYLSTNAAFVMGTVADMALHWSSAVFSRTHRKSRDLP